MYTDRLDDSNVTTPALSDQLLAEMHADHCDGVRCESAITSEELEQLAAAQVERRTAPEYKSIKERSTVLGVIDPATADALLAAVELRYNRPGILAVDAVTGDVTYTGPSDAMLYGAAILGPDDARDLGAIIAAHNDSTAAKPAPVQQNEVRVTVCGKKFKPAARLAGGKWVTAACHAREADAWMAAGELLATLIAKSPNRVA